MNPLWRVHTVTVEPFAGPGPTGDTFGAPVPCVGLLEEGTFREQTSEGETLVDRTVFYGDLADAATLVAESRVTLPSGRVCRIQRVRAREARGLFTAVEHVEVTLS